MGRMDEVTVHRVRGTAGDNTITRYSRLVTGANDDRRAPGSVDHSLGAARTHCARLESEN